MEKVNQIYNNEKYRKLLKELEEIEKDREFCKHDLEHFLNFSRIAYIKVLEAKIDISKEIIYAIGLLHDIGRVVQYKEGIEHHKASVEISNEILKDTTYTEEEKKLICNLIGSHRNLKEDKLQELIYVSDKLSRECYRCDAIRECYWEEEKKNMAIKY